MEEDNFQDDDNNVEITKEIKDKIEKGQCQICSMAEALSMIENSKGEKKNQDFEDDVVKAAKDYLYTFNRYGVNKGENQACSYLYLHLSAYRRRCGYWGSTCYAA